MTKKYQYVSDKCVMLIYDRHFMPTLLSPASIINLKM